MKEITVKVKKGEIVFIVKPQNNCRHCLERGFEYLKVSGGLKRIPCRCLSIRLPDNTKEESTDEVVPKV